MERPQTEPNQAVELLAAVADSQIAYERQHRLLNRLYAVTTGAFAVGGAIEVGAAAVSKEADLLTAAPPIGVMTVAMTVVCAKSTAAARRQTQAMRQRQEQLAAARADKNPERAVVQAMLAIAPAGSMTHRMYTNRRKFLDQPEA